jgi:hypothetical protein
MDPTTHVSLREEIVAKGKQLQRVFTSLQLLMEQTPETEKEKVKIQVSKLLARCQWLLQNDSIDSSWMPVQNETADPHAVRIAERIVSPEDRDAFVKEPEGFPRRRTLVHSAISKIEKARLLPSRVPGSHPISVTLHALEAKALCEAMRIIPRRVNGGPGYLDLLALRRNVLPLYENYVLRLNAKIDDERHCAKEMALRHFGPTERGWIMFEELIRTFTDCGVINEIADDDIELVIGMQQREKEIICPALFHALWDVNQRYPYERQFVDGYEIYSFAARPTGRDLSTCARQQRELEEQDTKIEELEEMVELARGHGHGFFPVRPIVRGKGSMGRYIVGGKGLMACEQGTTDDADADEHDADEHDADEHDGDEPPPKRFRKTLKGILEALHGMHPDGDVVSRTKMLGNVPTVFNKYNTFLWKHIPETFRVSPDDKEFFDEHILPELGHRVLLTRTTALKDRKYFVESYAYDILQSLIERLS